MFIHSVVYIILSILSATAAYASSAPVSKSPGEQQLSETGKTAARDVDATL